MPAIILLILSVIAFVIGLITGSELLLIFAQIYVVGSIIISTRKN